MKLDVKKALLSPFSEEKWYLKLIFPIFISACCTLSDGPFHVSKSLTFLIGLISLIPGIALSGFFIQFEHNEIHDARPLLPVLKSNFEKYLKYGLWVIFISICYLCIAGVLLLIFSPLYGYVSYLTKGNILLLILSSIFYLTPFFLLVLSFGFALSSYADSLDIKDVSDIKRTFRLISKVKLLILGYLLIFAGLTLIYLGINAILSISKYTIILSSISWVILQLININLEAQVYKIAKYRLENN